VEGASQGRMKPPSAPPSGFAGTGGPQMLFEHPTAITPRKVGSTSDSVTTFRRFIIGVDLSALSDGPEVGFVGAQRAHRSHD